MIAVPFYAEIGFDQLAAIISNKLLFNLLNKVTVKQLLAQQPFTNAFT